MGTKNNPGKFDCYKNAYPNEPMFILLGRDVCAGDLVRKWADDRERAINNGEKPVTDLPMVWEARECARSMDRYALDRGRALRRGDEWNDNDFIPPKGWHK
jgi:hypothetical protein